LADRIEWFDVTIPAGTPLNAPVTIPLVFQQGDVVKIDVKVLDGPCGSVGFQIGAGGSQYIPNTRGNYIRPNDDYFQWPQRSAINSGSFSLTAYNLDSWDHNIQVGFEVNELGTALAGQQSGSGQAAQTVLSAATSVVPSTVPVPDPLSPDSLLASVDPSVMAFLASQQQPSVTIAELTSAGTS
jgi:hypothetical protein